MHIQDVALLHTWHFLVGNLLPRHELGPALEYEILTGGAELLVFDRHSDRQLLILAIGTDLFVCFFRSMLASKKSKKQKRADL